MLYSKFDEFISNLKQNEYSENTISKYGHDVKKFLDFLGDLEITKERVLAYKELLTTSYKASSVNSMLGAVNVYLKFLGLHSCTVKRLKTQEKPFYNEDRDLSSDEYKRLVSAAIEKNDPQLAMIIQVICTTGIRVSELKYFTYESVCDGTVTVRNKGKVRTIVLVDQQIRAIKKYCKENGITSGVVFINKKGQSLSRQNIWRRVKSLAGIARLPRKKVFVHNLRHVFAKAYYKVKKDLVGLACLLGHSSVSTTQRYLRPNIKSCRKILRAMEIMHIRFT